MTRPCGLDLRPWRLLGFPMEPVDGAPGSLAGSFTQGRYGLPSTDSLAGLDPAGNREIQGNERQAAAISLPLW
jgi:hypothetical protein